MNRYHDFISQEFVATTPAGPLAQAINFADVTIRGLEASATAPIVVKHGVITMDGSAAYLHGTIVRGTNPQTGTDLSDTPADNITPFKFVVNTRFTEGRGRWWVEYGARTQSDVTRVARSLTDSQFLIAQDLLSLGGFTIHRLAWGIGLTRRQEKPGRPRRHLRTGPPSWNSWAASARRSTSFRTPPPGQARESEPGLPRAPCRTANRRWPSADRSPERYPD